MKMKVRYQFRIHCPTNLLAILASIAGTVTTAFSQTASPMATIAVQASPPSGGTVNGGGQYDSGTSVTVCATPEPGYEFVDWSGSAAPICAPGQPCPFYVLLVGSTSACFTVTANLDYNLVASFAPTNTPPPATKTCVFTDTPLWDVSGSYTNATVTNDLVIVNIQQHADGKVSGTRIEPYVAGLNHRLSSGAIAGRMVNNADALSANLRSNGHLIGVENGAAYTGKFTTKETLLLVPAAFMIIDTGSIRDCVSGHCVTSPAGGAFPLPHGMKGNWMLTFTTATRRNKLTGTATVTLSNGRALDYVVHGLWTVPNEIAKLRLVGTGDAAGTWLTITTQGPAMAVVALKGHVLSQKLAVP